MGRPGATMGKQGSVAMARGHVLDAFCARSYLAMTVEDLRTILEGHDPASPVLLRDSRGGLRALNDIESRVVPQRDAAGTRAAIVLAAPDTHAVDRAPADHLVARVVSLFSVVWVRIGAYGAGNVHRQFYRLDQDED